MQTRRFGAAQGVFSGRILVVSRHLEQINADDDLSSVFLDQARARDGGGAKKKSTRIFSLTNFRA